MTETPFADRYYSLIDTEGEPVQPGMMTPGLHRGRYTGRLLGKFETAEAADEARGRDVFCYRRIGILVAEDVAAGRGQVLAL